MDIELFAFEHFCPVRKRWIRARYKASREDIARRHAPGNWRTVGRPEVRTCNPRDTFTGNFGPARPSGGGGDETATS